MSLAISAAKPMGDPGIFGSIAGAVSRVAKTAATVAGAVLPGPIGTVARVATNTLWKPTVANRQPTSPTRPVSLPIPQPRSRTGIQSIMPNLPQTRQPPGVVDQRTSNLPAIEEETLFRDVTPAVACPKGYKPNKSAYYRRVKTPLHPDGVLVYVTPGSRCVKIRKRNAANPRAIDRAIGRVKSAKRLSKKLSNITIRDTCKRR